MLLEREVRESLVGTIIIPNAAMPSRDDWPCTKLHSAAEGSHKGLGVHMGDSWCLMLALEGIQRHDVICIYNIYQNMYNIFRCKSFLEFGL